MRSLRLGDMRDLPPQSRRGIARRIMPKILGHAGVLPCIDVYVSFPREPMVEGDGQV